MLCIHFIIICRLQVENDEQTDRKKYTKKKTEKGDFAFNFKSVVDSIDNSCK